MQDGPGTKKNAADELWIGALLQRDHPRTLGGQHGVSAPQAPAASRRTMHYAFSGPAGPSWR